MKTIMKDYVSISNADLKDYENGLALSIDKAKKEGLVFQFSDNPGLTITPEEMELKSGKIIIGTMRFVLVTSDELIR